MAWDPRTLVARLSAATGPAEAGRLCAEEAVSALGAAWASVWSGDDELGVAGDPGLAARLPGADGATFRMGSGASLVLGPGLVDVGDAALLAAVGGLTLSAAQSREDAAQSARTLSRLLYHVPSRVALTRGPDHVLEAVNAAFLDTLEGPVTSVIGRPARDALPGLAAQGFFQLADRVYRTGQRFVGEEVYAEFRYPDRIVESWQNIVFEPMHDDAGAVDGLLLFGTDVTALVRARKEAEEALAERARIQAQVVHLEKVESLGRLAAGVAHDFNNLLGVLSGNLELLEIEIGNPVAARARVKSLRAATGRATELTRQLMSFAGRGVAASTVVELVGATEEMLTLLRTSLRSGVRLQTRLPVGPLGVRGDRASLQQVLMSLFLNAVDAIGDAGGTLRVTLSAVTVDEDARLAVYGREPLPAGRYASMVVADDGLGMSDETQRRIFDPFFTTRPGGRGLGLPAALGVVHALGGGIRVESRLGAGTTMEVLCPLVDLPPDRGDPPSAPRTSTLTPTLTPMPLPVGEPVGPRGEVLVVDDDEGIRELLELAIAPLGHPVHLAADGASARLQAAALGDRVGLVLLDLSLPDCAPDEIYLDLRSALPEAAIVLCTGVAEGDARRLVGGGRDLRVLTKPFDVRVLLRTVGAAFARR